MNRILIVLTILSFLPELRRIITRKSSTDVSLYYVAFSCINATKLPAFLSWCFIFSDQPVHIIRKPYTLGDWLNISQLAIGWFMSLAL